MCELRAIINSNQQTNALSIMLVLSVVRHAKVSLYPYSNYDQENFNPSFFVIYKGAKEK